MQMEITGEIIDCLPVKSGQSAKGEWRKQEYVLQTDGQYPKKICFMVWGEKVEQFAIQQGEMLQVSIDLESREYNGRWYTDVKAWRVSRDGSGAGTSYPTEGQDAGYDPMRNDASLENDVIPF